VLNLDDIFNWRLLRQSTQNSFWNFIKKYLPFLFLSLPSKGRKRFWDMATLVMGNRGEENGKLIIRVFIFDFITISET
jgi:hypothetical protein